MSTTRKRLDRLPGPSLEAQHPADLLTNDHSGDPPHLEVRLRERSVPPTELLASIVSARGPLASLTVLCARVDPAVATAILDLYRRFGDQVSFSADIQLDPDADACAAIGGGRTRFSRVLEASRTLRRTGVPVRWRIAPAGALVYRLEALFSLAADEDVDAVLTGFDDGLDDEGRRFLADFLEHRLLGEERAQLAPGRASFYETLLANLTRQGTPAGGAPDRVLVVSTAPGGDWRVEVELSRLPRAVLGPPGVPSSRSSGQPIALADLVEVLTEGTRAVAQWSLAALSGRAFPPKRHEHARTLPRVLVIGAYGGDHIGDTAILGGVLIRMYRRYGTTGAILVSQRAAHSRRLAGMLDVPVSITVEEYRQSAVAALLAQVDGVVFAGGPLMDLPKQLVKHLYTVALARRAGMPFVIEGIGAGPFIRRASAWTARLLVQMAERITVRTAEDAGRPLVGGLRPLAGRDPAFDYLETRGGPLTRLPDADGRSLDRLLAGTAGRPIIAINLRPLRPDYTVGPSVSERAAYTRMVEARFEERLAEAIARFHQASPDPPCFIFFPMNSIQFGSSDLRSAYRLKRRVGAGVDLRVWEEDPSIDGIVALLRRVDLAITMRFHATIYALAQGKPVIGVDYRPGKKDKVAALLEDAGQGHNCGRIDELTTEWMFDRLVRLTPARTSGSTLRPDPPPVPR